MKKYWFLFALIGILAISCSDDSTSPTKGKILPMTIGSWWLYDNYDIDSNNVKTKAMGYDSVVAVSKSTILDHDGTTFVTYSKDNSGIETGTVDNFYYEEDQKLYMHSSAFSSAISSQLIPFTFKEQWMKVADKNDEDWKLYDEAIDPMTIAGVGTVTGKILINGERGGTKSFTIEGRNIVADEYLLNINFNGSISLLQAPLPIILDRVMKIYFADGIGLISQSMAPSVIPVLIIDIPMPGTETILKKYSIK